MRRLIVAGNWKMNKQRDSAVQLTKAVADGAAQAAGSIDVVVAPPFVYLPAVLETAAGTPVTVAAQNAWHAEKGAYTGEVSLSMLQDLGVETVILGHSERRDLFGETDELINAKTTAALNAGMTVIFCLGEQKQQRLADETDAVLDRQLTDGLKGIPAEQLSRLVIAYEPVWAIGTGLTATPEQAEGAHQFIRNWVSRNYSQEAADRIQILYGGSVKPSNAAELLAQPNVDGALVGGASLEPDQFLPIIEAAANLAKSA